jgi:PAS domain S-box-containing protein
VDGNGDVSIRGSFQDITDMRLAVEAFRASEEQFRQLFDTISDSVFIHALDGGFILANRGTLDNLGCGAQAIQALRVQDIEAPEFAAAFPRRMEDLAALGSLVFETVHAGKDGKRIPVEVRSALIDFRGEKAVLNVARDIGERKLAEERIMRTLGERETLLREVFHRTRNNMQVILALLAFEEESARNERVSEVVKKTSERIMSMALVHQKLYQSQDLSRIDLKEYAEELLGSLRENRPDLAGRVGLDTAFQEIHMLIDAAVPFGLVLQELVSNALGHAFPDGRKGTVSVRISRDEQGTVNLDVADDGIGLPEDFSARCANSVGINLVRGLIEHQLRGTVELDTTLGVTCRVRFNDAQYMKRV